MIFKKYQKMKKMFLYNYCDYWKSENKREKVLIDSIKRMKLYQTRNYKELNWNKFGNFNHPVLRIIYEENPELIFDKCMFDLQGVEKENEYVYWFCRLCFIVTKEGSYINENCKLILRSMNDEQLSLLEKGNLFIINKYRKKILRDMRTHLLLVLKDAYFRYMYNVTNREVLEPCRISDKHKYKIKIGKLKTRIYSLLFLIFKRFVYLKENFGNVIFKRKLMNLTDILDITERFPKEIRSGYFKDCNNILLEIEKFHKNGLIKRKKD
jgi:hypothetical protein